MPGASGGDFIVRHHRHGHPQRRHHEQHLAAIPPRIGHLVAADASQEPAVAVIVAAESRPGARLPRALDPLFGEQPLTRRNDAAVSVQLAHREQRARTHGHLIAAEVDPLGIALPVLDVEPFQWTQPLLRQFQRGASGCAGKRGRQQMGGAGGVEHGAARVFDERLRQGGPHPVVADDPAPVVRTGGARQPSLHRQQVADGDLRQTRVVLGRQVLLEQRRDLLLDTLEHAAVDGHSHQRRHDDFRRRFDVAGRGGGMAAIAALGDDDAVLSHHHGLQRRQRLGPIEHPLQPPGVNLGADGRLGCLRQRNRRGQRQHGEPQRPAQHPRYAA